MTGTQPEPLTTTQKRLIALVVTGGILIAAIGFAGSYMAVSELAAAKHFGWFARVFPIGVDAGIAVMLALDLVLTGLRMPFPLLRQTAWFLTAATVAFNASSAWGDWLAVGMHATIPALFIVTMEAARHAVGRIASITADRHIESPPWQRWVLSPVGTFVIWRRQRVWQIPSYVAVIEQQRELRVFRAQLRKDYGRWVWRREAPADKLLVFQLARFGVSVSEALAKPEVEAEAQRRAEVARAAEARRNREAEAEALRIEEAKRREEAEARRLAEAEAEARLAEIARRERLAEAEVQDELAAREQRRLDAEAEAAKRRQQEAIELARQAAEVEARRLAEAEEAARRTAEAEAEALRVAQERVRLEAEALRKLQAAPRAENPKPKQAEAETARPKPKREAETANPKPKPTNLNGRRARIEAEVETLLDLMRTEGYDAVNLKRVMDDLGLTQTTAFDRLQRAQAKYSEAA